MVNFRTSESVHVASLVSRTALREFRGQCRCRAVRVHLSSPQRCSFAGRSLVASERQGKRRRSIQTLAIETSCDDTSVAVLSISGEKDSPRLHSNVLFHEKITANSHGYSGIHPLVALDSHRRELGALVQRAVLKLEPTFQRDASNDGDIHPAVSAYPPRPDFVTVTRGPGMRSNLDVGLHTAKGLALAWDVPLVGVNHMQAHALTPRFCTTINAVQSSDGSSEQGNDSDATLRELGWSPGELEPRFPFLGLLVSGGHTMLIESKSLNDHRVLAQTEDIAIGDYLDKVARTILRESELKTPYGKALEDFAFPSATRDFETYHAPLRRQEGLEPRSTGYEWSLNPPLSQNRRGGKSNRRMLYSFAGLLSSVMQMNASAVSEDSTGRLQSSTISDMPLVERRQLAREAQIVAFEHLGSRILLHLENNQIPKAHSSHSPPYTVVVSGGVASNKFLRYLLRQMLDVRGYANIRLLFPPPELCTDNALMIAWAGMEMYDAGYESDLSIGPLRKWSMDPHADDGGILGVEGWKRRSGDGL